MISLPKSFRFYRVAFIVVVIWILALICFHEQLSTIKDPESKALYWIIGGVLISLVASLRSAPFF